MEENEQVASKEEGEGSSSDSVSSRSRPTKRTKRNQNRNKEPQVKAVQASAQKVHEEAKREDINGEAGAASSGNSKKCSKKEGSEQRSPN